MSKGDFGLNLSEDELKLIEMSYVCAHCGNGSCQDKSFSTFERNDDGLTVCKNWKPRDENTEIEEFKEQEK